jgi:hypothetical protein
VYPLAGPGRRQAMACQEARLVVRYLSQTACSAAWRGSGHVITMLRLFLCPAGADLRQLDGSGDADYPDEDGDPAVRLCIPQSHRPGPDGLLDACGRQLQRRRRWEGMSSGGGSSKDLPYEADADGMGRRSYSRSERATAHALTPRGHLTPLAPLPPPPSLQSR